MTPEAARALDFGTSGTLGFPRRELTVGAFADNAVPNLGDVMVSSHIARLGSPDEVIVGVKDGADLDAIEPAGRDMLFRRVGRVLRVRLKYTEDRKPVIQGSQATV
mgnify:CR=1 FL=1